MVRILICSERGEPEIYGALTLADIEENLQFQAEQLGCTVSTVQSNAEHELIEYVQQARGQVDFIILNPAAYTHTSVALRDALAAVAIPFIEVHLSNVHAREAFRRHSYFSDLAQAVICVAAVRKVTSLLYMQLKAI